MIYHYTLGLYLPRIQDDGYLKLTPSQEVVLPGETRAVWFTTMKKMPPTAQKPMSVNGKLRRVTLGELSIKGQGLYRFAGDKDALGALWWQRHKKKLAHGSQRRSLEQYAKSLDEKPASWYVVTRPVDIQEVRLEKFIAGKWEEVSLETESVSVDGSHVRIIREAEWKPTATVY